MDPRVNHLILLLLLTLNLFLLMGWSLLAINPRTDD
jgi:hypothetical protein